MQEKSVMWRLALAVLALFVLLAPSQAHANAADTVLGTFCDDGTFDTKVQNNQDAENQKTLAKMIDVTNQFPIIPATNACIENIISLLQQLPTLSDPFGLAASIITPMINQVINSACAAVMQQITAAQNLIKNAFTICLPMPNFNLHIANNSTSAACTGGTPFSLISGFSSAGVRSYSTSDHLQH